MVDESVLEADVRDNVGVQVPLIAPIINQEGEFMKKLTIQLETLTCPSCLQKINAAVKKLDGINKDKVEVLFNASRVRLEFNDEVIKVADIEETIEKVGYKAVKSTIRK